MLRYLCIDFMICIVSAYSIENVVLKGISSVIDVDRGTS